jgi:nitroreductase
MGLSAMPHSFDMGQAAAYLQLAAWELGIGSCIVGLHHSEVARAVLQVPAELNARIAITFGYPLPVEQPKTPKKNGRKPLSEIVRWETWS